MPIRGPYPQAVNVLPVKAFGAKGDGTTDDATAINAAITAASATVGPCEVYIPPGVYIANSVINMLDKPNVTLRGAGGSNDPYAGAPTNGTVIKRGSGAGTVLSVGSTASSTRSVQNGKVLDLAIDGNNAAATGLLVTSAYGWEFRNVHVRECTSVAIKLTTVDLSALEDTQNCNFKNITVRQVNASTGDGIICDSGAAGLGNTSANQFENIIIDHTGGIGLKLVDCDTNTFAQVLINRPSGAGVGLDILGSNHASSGHARENIFFHLQPGAGGVTSRGTGTYSQPPKNNVIYGYSLGNSSAVPTVEAGSRLTWYYYEKPLGRERLYEYEDFISNSLSSGGIGKMGWKFTGGTITEVDSADVGHPGVVRRDTGAGAGTASYMYLFSTSIHAILPAETFDTTWIIKLDQTDTDTAVRFGLQSTNANPPSDGIFFEKVYADTNWFAVCRASAAQTRSDMSVATAVAWVALRIRRINGTTIGFTINNGTEVTINSNVPTAGLSPLCLIINQSAVSKTVQIDYWELSISNLAR